MSTSHLNPNNTTERLLEDYLRALSLAFKDQDIALIQDALFDAEDHIRAYLTEEDNADITVIIENYGSPEEIAEQYCEMELTVNLAMHGNPKARSPLFKHAFFNVLSDMSAYRAMLYFLLASPIGVIYFAWVLLFGLISTLASVVLVGIPFSLIFLKSMPLFSLFEGRLIEMLLEVRMPRRPRYQHIEYTNTTLSGQIANIKEMLGNRRSWTTMLYLVIQPWLGIGYFLTIALLAIFSIAVFISPLVDAILHAINPVNTIDIQWYWFPLAMPAGFIGFVASLHIARHVGKWHARLAKYLLVNDAEKLNH